MTFSSAKIGIMIPAQPKSSMGPRVLTVRELASTCGSIRPGLSAAQGTEAALISDRLSLAFQPRRDRTVEGPRTETKLICVPCDRTATAKRQRQEANYPCGPEFNFSWVFERSRH